MLIAINLNSEKALLERIARHIGVEFYIRTFTKVEYCILNSSGEYLYESCGIPTKAELWTAERYISEFIEGKTLPEIIHEMSLPKLYSKADLIEFSLFIMAKLDEISAGKPVEGAKAEILDILSVEYDINV